MNAVLIYSLLLAVLFLLSLLCYLLCKDNPQLRQAEDSAAGNKTTAASIISVLSNREIEALETSQKPKYKRTNLEIEIPQTPRETEDLLTFDWLLVMPRQGECVPFCLCMASKSMQRYQRIVVFSTQLLADCFLSSLLIDFQWETRGLSKYFTAGLVACISASPVSLLITLLFLRCGRNRPSQPLVLVLLFLLAMVLATLDSISALNDSQTDQWIGNFVTLMGLEVAILEPIRTLLKLVTGKLTRERSGVKDSGPISLF